MTALMTIFFTIFKKIFEFLQSSSGESSSKRLMMIASCGALIWKFCDSMDKLIAGQHATEAVELFQLFVIFVAICGGFVTVEVLSRLAEITAQLKFGKTNNIKKKWTKKQSNL